MKQFGVKKVVGKNEVGLISSNEFGRLLNDF